MKVAAYWNLHKHLWSLKAMEGPQKGLVIAHRETLTLTDCVCRVQPAGNARVRAEGRKNVHAYIKGTLQEQMPEVTPGTWRAVTYNPYTTRSFMAKDAGTPGAPWEPIQTADLVYFEIDYDGRPAVTAGVRAMAQLELDLEVAA